MRALSTVTVISTNKGRRSADFRVRLSRSARSATGPERRRGADEEPVEGRVTYDPSGRFPTPPGMIHEISILREFFVMASRPAPPIETWMTQPLAARDRIGTTGLARLALYRTTL
ncbi:hypothetical protein GCM10010156_02260 [Planobispora rosea]|uniref:Uncharacterized protein n=1 Tax=Planobispora rosea TaxID=35762 RepID=A0A8J3WBV6_PLARO|nr:hypothetical protein GCM10010156_02260 [Planobispora rosea]GIH82261.1 hypothetical protein Pro02_06690 [Planobispora rosea]